MKFHVLTLFPEIPRAFFESSIMAKAVEKEIIAYDLVNIRDFAFDKHKTCDDSPYGGGAGMLMLPEPLDRALESVKAYKKRVIYVTPSGKPFTQKLARELSKEEELVFICGRYEGIDQRIIDAWVDDEVSIGDYVEGVISSESLEEESFSTGLLEYPQYTRPEVYKGMKVPEVLLSGHHENIRKWRLERQLAKTLAYRPDLIDEARRTGELSLEAEKMIETITGQVSKVCPRKHPRYRGKEK